MYLQRIENTIKFNQDYSFDRIGTSENLKINSDNTNITFAAPEESDTVSEKIIDKNIEKLNKALNGTNKEFRYAVHEKTKSIMVKVMDKDSGEVIREVPSKKILDMVAKMWEMSGILVDQRI